MSKSLFTSESVFPGHPDRLCDQISDAILDACLERDPSSRVAVEAMACPDHITVAGEITTNADVDYERIARNVVKNAGYIHKGLGFRYDTLSFSNHIHTQSPDIGRGVDAGGAGDNGIMFGGACWQSSHFMPYPIAVSRALERNFRRYCEDNKEMATLFRPDGKTQVTIGHEDGRYSCECVVFNVQTAEEAEDAANPHDTTYRNAILTNVIKPTLRSFDLNDECPTFINPTGRFVIGGPFGDCGLTGRKIVVATYGGYYRHGGGAQSGKDPSKVDKSGVLMSRYIAKNIVAAGLSDDIEVQLGYAIGVKEPVSISFNNLDRSEGVDHRTLEKAVRAVFDCTFEGIRNAFRLCENAKTRGFLYRDLAAYGYVGGDVFDETGSLLPWEETDKADELFREATKGA